MHDEPVVLNILDTVENIRDVLTSNDHHAFPLINSEYKLVGIIPRNFIIVILKHQAWYSEEALNNGSFSQEDNTESLADQGRTSRDFLTPND